VDGEGGVDESGDREEYPTASAQLLRGENPKEFRRFIKS